MAANDTDVVFAAPDHVPRFCGQIFMERQDKREVRGLERVRAFNDWMIDDWCGDTSRAERLIPAERFDPLRGTPVLAAAEVRRLRPQGFCSGPRAPPSACSTPGPAQHRTAAALGPAFGGLPGDRHGDQHAHGAAFELAASPRPDAPVDTIMRLSRRVNALRRGDRLVQMGYPRAVIEPRAIAPSRRARPARRACSRC